MDKFVVDQKARIVGNIPAAGIIVTILEPRKFHSIMNAWTGRKRECFVYKVQLEESDRIALKQTVGRFYISEHHLLPIGDQDNKISWDECSWKPNPETIKYLEELHSH